MTTPSRSAPMNGSDRNKINHTIDQTTHIGVDISSSLARIMLAWL
jgi:hypothetical protein